MQAPSLPSIGFHFYGPFSSLAQFLWFTKPNPPGKKRPMIEMILKPKEDLKE
jgi:hypothetical protein